MTYRITYDDGLAAAAGTRSHQGVTRTEYFRTEFEALQRARQLLEDGDHHAVSLCDSTGRVLAGIRLQLKLEASITGQPSALIGIWSRRKGGLPGPPFCA